MSDHEYSHRSIESSTKSIANSTRTLAICAIVGVPIAAATVYLMLPDKEGPSVENRVSNQPGVDASQERRALDAAATGNDRDTHASAKPSIVLAPEPSVNSNAALLANEFCERDSSRMGTDAEYEFTESPYCATDSIPNRTLVLTEVPHPE